MSVQMVNGALTFNGQPIKVTSRGTFYQRQTDGQWIPMPAGVGQVAPGQTAAQTYEANATAAATPPKAPWDPRMHMDATGLNEMAVLDANHSARNTFLAGERDRLKNDYFRADDPYSRQNELRRALTAAKDQQFYGQASQGHLYSGASETARAAQIVAGGQQERNLNREYTNQDAAFVGQQIDNTGNYNMSRLQAFEGARQRYLGS